MIYKKFTHSIILALLAFTCLQTPQSVHAKHSTLIQLGGLTLTGIGTCGTVIGILGIKFFMELSDGAFPAKIIAFCTFPWSIPCTIGGIYVLKQGLIEEEKELLAKLEQARTR